MPHERRRSSILIGFRRIDFNSVFWTRRLNGDEFSVFNSRSSSFTKGRGVHCKAKYHNVYRSSYENTRVAMVKWL